MRKRFTMNIEQKTNMQELAEEDYTKVYAGTGPMHLCDEELLNILPELPPPPDGHKVEI
jgi:propanediol dehydratase small subunit|tara:strand:- start:118 stop:294 length:177 start_codon:yes stop_codon:yes gene_type:complete